LGSKVAGEREINLYSTAIKTRSFQPGLYVAKVTMEGNVIVTSKFIIK
jgi:hypothetical protein